MSNDPPRLIPDDPDACFTDRLLLALGMQPEHVERLGQDAAIEAAVQFRWMAHQHPMIAEDYGTERELREHLEGIVRALADSNPIEARTDGTFWCRLCGTKATLPVPAPGEHTEGCPWRQAGQYVEAVEDA